MRALVARAWCSGAVTDTRHRGRSSDARCLALVLVVLLAAVVGVVVAAGAAADPLPPADPAAPWQTRDDALLPYPVFHPAVAVLNNSIVLLGGCVTATCATPVGSPSPADAAHASTPAVRSSVGSPYHVQSLAIHVELGTVKALPRLTLPAEMGFAGRYAAVTLTDSVYVARSCTHTTHSPRDVAAMTPAERSTLQAAYAPILALYPEEAGSPGTALPAVNLSYFDVPADRVRVNASCTALATENKVLIIGGFLLSEQRVTASVDSFDVVTRRYDTDVAMLSAPVMHAAVATSTGVAVVAGGWTYEADASGAAAATSSTPPLHRQVMQRLLDLFFFDADSGVCASPVDVSALPNTVVGDILRSPSGCHVELFGGQVVLANHNLGNIAVLNIRAAPAWASHGVVAQVSSLLRAPPPPPASLHATTQRVGNSSRSSISPSPTPDSTSSSTTPTPPPPPPPPPPAYSYTWAGPTLVSLPAARHPNDTATAAGDTVLLYHAFGGQDQWWRTAAAAAVAGPGDKRSDGDDGDELVRAEPARRWALRAVPDAQHDTDRPELLEVTMPTPVWPDDLTLHTTSDGIIRVVFSDVDYTRYCTWGRSGDEVCAVRLSSRRDCVGTTAGTLDSPYGGAANATVRFSASGSTTPVYVCLGYVVQPIAWSLCRSRLSFTIVNPMMPLGILDSSRTTTRAPPPAPPTPPPPTRDPADKATGSPLFALAVGVAVVTLLVAVLLVARLQHVPEEGLLSADVFERGGGGGGGGGDADGTPSRVPDWRRRRRRLPRATVASGSSDDERAAALPTAMTEEEEEGEDSDGVTGRRSSVDSYEEYCHLVEAVQEERETRMLTAAADVLSLHQSRYRVVSSIGQGEHSLCFLALRRTPPPPQQQQQQQQRRRVDTGTGVGRGARALGRFVASLLRLTPHTHTPTVSSAERSPYMAPGAAVASPSVPASSPRSSLWAARHDESVAVAVKYTQCPDDATRAIITRLCERLRDLHADAVTTTAACRPPPPQQKRQRPPPVQQSCRRASDVSATPADAGGASGAATETGQAAEAVLASERSSGLVTVATSTTTTSRTGTLSMLCAGAEAVAAVNVRDHANDDHNDHNGGDGADSDGDVDASCAVLDTHEVSVVLALFLLLPEDLFVSYEVSVLHHHQQQQHHHQHHHHHRSSGNSSSGGGGGGRRRYMSATQRTASREAVRWNMTHIWAGDGAAPRVCWTACINACHPPAVNPWSLCLAMPYERAGDLASFIRRCQHALQLPAAAVPDAPRHHHGSDDADDSGGASLGVPPVYAGWRESLLCSMLFQVGAGLQLLHAQSPPILHGNITATNVLLREPAVFSVARRRVVGAAPTVGAVQEGGTPGQARCITAATEASGGAGAPWRARSLVAAAAAWRVGSPLLRSAPPRLPPLPPDTDAEGLLCTHTYLPLTITDAGMSWWLAAQLPQRLRGCFGRTTRSSLQRTADGRQWLRRHDDGGEGFVPAPACIVALSRFLIHFVEVPTHIAPEMLWGRLCAHSVSDGSDGDTAAAAGLSSSTVRRHPSRRRRERRPRCSGAVAQDDGRGVPDSAATRSTSASGASVRAANTRDAAGDWDDDDDDDTGEIFTREEVRALTAAMWRAEGLTRMPRRGGAGRPSRTTTTTTTAVAVRQTPVHADAPDAAAGPRSHTGSPLLAAPAGATSLMSRRRCGGRRRGSAGGGTSVYELLVQRVLAVNTASDMWGLGVLLYSMCTDAVADSRLLGAPALSTETEAAATTAAAAAVSPPPRPSSRLAEQCFAALLGDLFDLAALFSAGDGDAEDIGGISTEARASAVVADADKDDDDDDAHRWPRSRAVEAAVERSFTDAGYSRALASLLAAMLSPVAARRPTAGEVVAQLRLVHPADGAEARHMSGSSSSGGSGVAVGHPWRPPPHRSTDATSAVVLHERTAHMTLRRR